MAEKIQDKKGQKQPAGRQPEPRTNDKNQRPEASPKKGNDNKKKW